MSSVRILIGNAILLNLLFWNICQCAEGQNQETWNSLLAKSNALMQAKQYDSALVISRLALREAISTNGENDSSVAMCWHRVSGMAFQLKLPEMDSLLREAVAAWAKVPNANQVERAKTLSNYGLYLSGIAPFVDGLPYIEECLEIRMKYQAADTIGIGRTELKLGQTYVKAGKPGFAIPHLQRASELFVKSSKPVGRTLTECYNATGMAYYQLGQTSRAEEYAELAIAKAKEANDTNWVAIYSADLANYLITANKLAEADSICVVALAMVNKEDTTSTDSEMWEAVVRLYNSRGIALWQSHHYEPAESCFVQSIALRKSRLGHADTPDLLRTQYSLANLYRDFGKYARAESLYVYVLEQRRKSHGKTHRDIAYSLYSLGRLYAVTGRHEAAFDTSYTCYQMRATIIDEQAAELTEPELLDYSTQLRVAAEQCISVAATSETVAAKWAGQLAELMLRTKGYVSDHIFRQENNKPEKGNVIAADLLKKVTAAIPQRATLIDFFRYGLTEFRSGILPKDSDSGNMSYAALILTKDSAPKVVFLGLCNEIDSLMAGYKSQLATVAQQGHQPTLEQTSEFSAITREIYRRVVAPVENHLQNPLLLISPDGDLNTLSFATLTSPDGKFLVESHAIHYLSAGRDVARAYASSNGTEGMLAFADPDFDAQPDKRINRPELSSVGTTATSKNSRTRSQFADCLYTRGLAVGRLPNTLREAQSVCSQWESITGQKSTQFTGAIASEDNFKRNANTATVVYVATHGFFVDSLCAATGAEDSFTGNSYDETRSMLAQSGFLLSGANLAADTSLSAGVEDGIVSAAEIAEMSFPQAPMVVLSACESALGKIQNGEGVYGLRRAFLLAGARTVVSALWKIDDKTTSEMMGQLFAGDSGNLPERIRAAQLTQISKLRSEKRADHPYSWGAFIATGDWR